MGGAQGGFETVKLEGPPMPYSRVPKALFDVSLNALALTCCRSGTLEATGGFAEDFKRLPESLSDALMVAPRLTFKVTGVNLPLAVLAETFGASGVEELLRQGDIEFVLWREYLGIIQTPVEGLVPFAPGSFSNPEHCDPEVSNAKGLLAASSISDSQRQRLAKLATKRTTTTNPQGAKKAWQALVDAHKSGALSGYGVPSEMPLSTISMAQKARLGMELLNLHHASEVIERELDLFESPETWAAMLLLAREVNSSPRVVSSAEEILKEDRAPSVGALVTCGILEPSEVLSLRGSSEARAFREWLWTQPDPADAASVLDEYRRLIVKDRRSLDGKWWYRTLRVFGVGATSFLAGVAIPGESTLTTAAVGVGVSLADELLRLMREQRSPRRFSRMLQDARY
jgi:hypothetical protein